MLANTPAKFGTLLTRQGLEDFTFGLECPHSTVALASEMQVLLGQGPSVTQFRAHKAEKIISYPQAEALQSSNMKSSMALALLVHG